MYMNDRWPTVRNLVSKNGDNSASGMSSPEDVYGHEFTGVFRTSGKIKINGKFLSLEV